MLKMIISAAKTMLGAAVMLIAVTTTVSAQDRSADGAKKATDRMKTQLTLTDAQYPKVEQINKDFIDKLKESRSTTDKAEREKKVNALNADKDTKLKAVLTDEQFKMYSEKKAKRLSKISSMNKSKALNADKL